MFKSGVNILLTSVLLALVAFTACEQSTSTEFEESFADVREVTPIEVTQPTSMDLQVDENQNSYFTVRLNDGSTREGWCIEWNKASVKGVQGDVELFSTKGKESWKELNYFMSIVDDLREEDPNLTYREIQVVIWSLVDNPTFDVDKISEYENISSRIYKDGQALFNVQKVKQIEQRVFDHFATKQKEHNDEEYEGVIFIKNNGQTIMVKSETAFAYGDSYATCFDEFQELKSNRWGWSNGALAEGEYTFDMYAGAGQCDLSKGTLVGELHIKYENGTAKVTFTTTEISSFTGQLYTMTATHLYVSDEGPIPVNNKNNKYTVAPGQYGNVTSGQDHVTEYTYTINNLDGEIYVIGHADVAGFEL